MASITEIRKFVSEYLNRSITGEVFGERVIRMLYELAPDSESDLRHLVHALNAKVAEVHLGLISDYEFYVSLLSYSDRKPTVEAGHLTIVSPDSHFEVLELATCDL